MSPAQRLPRFVEGSVHEALSDTPVIVVQGARQVGKSTLVDMVTEDVPGALRVTLDDPETLRVARQDPTFFVNQANEHLLVIDEAQRAPELILPLKASVDRDRRPGRFLLTGSADLLRVRGVGDSLAGRAETIELKPLSQGEIARKEVPEDFVSWVLARGQDPTSQRAEPLALSPPDVIAGGYPVPLMRSGRGAARWFHGYIQRIATHDATELHDGGFAEHLRSLVTLLGAGGQQELVKAKLARSLEVSQTTLDSYLRLAATMRLVELLPAWGRSHRSRVTKRPKVSLNDSGLAAAVIDFTASRAGAVGGREYYGALVEQFVTLELLKQQGWSAEWFNLFHFRDLDGLEVDIVVELRDGRLIAIEVKSGLTIGDRSWRNLERFRQRFKERDVTGVVLYSGTQSSLLHGWLHLLPITSLWQHPPL